MSKTIDFESPDDLRRIQFIVEIGKESRMSKCLDMVKKFEKDMRYWQTPRGKAKLRKHKKLMKNL